VEKIIILVNWLVFFPFKPHNLDEKQKESSHGLHGL
jgi:hypothetical protein